VGLLAILATVASPAPPFTLRYELTPDVVIDAARLHQAATFRLILVAVAGLVSVAVFVAGVALLLDDLELLWFTVIILAMAGLILTFTQGRWLMRWSVRRSARTVLGSTTEMVVDDIGIDAVTTLGRSSVNWSQLTGVRENERTVVFERDRLLVGFLPAAAFSSPEQRAAVLRFARERIASSRSEPTAQR
jgi:hypothetical protein